MSLDPRTQLIAGSLLICTTFLTHQGIYLVGLCGLLAVTFLVSRSPFSRFFRNILRLAWLLLCTVLAHIAGNSISWTAGIEEGIFRGTQLIIAVGWATLLGTHTTPFTLVHGLERLGHPIQRLGIPVQKFTLVTMLSLRFLPLLAQEGTQLLHAYIARGIDLNTGNVFNRLKNYIVLSIPLLNSMLRRVEHIANAMESRAYHARSERTTLHELRMYPIDYLVLVGSFLLLLLPQLI